MNQPTEVMAGGELMTRRQVAKYVDKQYGTIGRWIKASLAGTSDFPLPNKRGCWKVAEIVAWWNE